MVKKFTPFWIGMAVVALLAGAGAAAFLFISNIPPVTQQVEHGGDYILVNLTHPLSGDALPLNAPTWLGPRTWLKPVRCRPLPPALSMPGPRPRQAPTLWWRALTIATGTSPSPTPSA